MDSAFFPGLRVLFISHHQECLLWYNFYYFGGISILGFQPYVQVQVLAWHGKTGAIYQLKIKLFFVFTHMFLYCMWVCLTSYGMTVTHWHWWIICGTCLACSWQVCQTRSQEGFFWLVNHDVQGICLWTACIWSNWILSIHISWEWQMGLPVFLFCSWGTCLGMYH